jgi:hypothetical protein
MLKVFEFLIATLKLFIAPNNYLIHLVAMRALSFAFAVRLPSRAIPHFFARRPHKRQTKNGKRLDD